MTEKKKSGAGKFFLGAALGAIAGAIAGKFVSVKTDEEEMEECPCGEECKCCEEKVAEKEPETKKTASKSADKKSEK